MDRGRRGLNWLKISIWSSRGSQPPVPSSATTPVTCVIGFRVNPIMLCYTPLDWIVTYRSMKRSTFSISVDLLDDTRRKDQSAWDRCASWEGFCISTSSWSSGDSCCVTTCCHFNARYRNMTTYRDIVHRKLMDAFEGITNITTSPNLATASKSPRWSEASDWDDIISPNFAVNSTNSFAPWDKANMVFPFWTIRERQPTFEQKPIDNAAVYIPPAVRIPPLSYTVRIIWIPGWMSHDEWCVVPWP